MMLDIGFYCIITVCFLVRVYCIFDFTVLPIVCAFFSILLAVMIDVVLAVNSDIKIAPANIHKTPSIRAMIDLGALSPYLKNADAINRLHCV